MAQSCEEFGEDCSTSLLVLCRPMKGITFKWIPLGNLEKICKFNLPNAVF